MLPAHLVCLAGLSGVSVGLQASSSSRWLEQPTYPGDADGCGRADCGNQVQLQEQGRLWYPGHCEAAAVWGWQQWRPSGGADMGGVQCGVKLRHIRYTRTRQESMRAMHLLHTSLRLFVSGFLL